MKRKLLISLMILTRSASMVSCKSREPENTEKPKTSETSNDVTPDVSVTSAPEEAKSNSDENHTGSDGSISDLDALDDVEVEKELFDVHLTIPAEFIGQLNTDELKQKAAEEGFEITINEDGSASYTMTKSQHKTLMGEMSETFHSALSEMIGSENYPNITNVTANENFTSFTVTTTSPEVDMNESFSVMAFYMYGGMYGIFNGETPDNIHVDFVNADSGEIIHSADSSDAADMGQQ